MLTQADSRVGGMQIQPFSLQKQAAVRTGVANAIGVQASDVSLDILTVFGSQVSPSFCLCCALEMLNLGSLASLNMSPPTLSPSSCAAHLPVYWTELVCWLLTVHLGESWGGCMQSAAGRKLLQPPGLPGADQLSRPGQPGQPGPQVLSAHA